MRWLDSDLLRAAICLNPPLPIWQLHEQILGAVRESNRLVLVAPTGSGKTTQVPQMLWDAGVGGGKKIIILQPRRVAARTVAARVAWERSCILGGEVGYQVRFDDRTSLGTRLCFITEGILLRWLQDDAALEDIGAVLFDEFHERNLLSDVALGLVKRLQKQSRPDLKIIVMSATLDAEPVAKYLDDCPILVSEGRSFPVETHFISSEDERDSPDQAVDVVERLLQSNEHGDILIFMPGMGEIQATIRAGSSVRTTEKLAWIPLHGDLQPEEQDRAFASNPLRKVIVATNVAETSVTIDGIRHVVDAGLARVARFDAERGLGTLFIEEISRASADQRAGRAGRTAPGTCWRLWTESNHLNRPARNTPEIQRTDLAEVVLLLHSLGIRKAGEFQWLDRPDPVAVDRAESLLRMLGALHEEPQLEEHNDLTPVGRKMLGLPMHPRYSRMLVEASKTGCVPAAALCAALVSGRDLLVRLGREDKHVSEARELFEGDPRSDFFTLIRAFNFAAKNNFQTESCRRYGVHAQSARQVAQTYEQILEIAKRQNLIKQDEPVKGTDEALLRALMAGFIDQLCVRRDSGTLDCNMTEGRMGTLVRESVVQKPNFFVSANIREVSGRGGHLTLLSLVSTVNLEWIRECFPQHLREKIEHRFDRTHKRVAAVKLLFFRDLPLLAEPHAETDASVAAETLAEAVQREWIELPNYNHELKQWIARVQIVAQHMPGLGFPTLDSEELKMLLARAFHGLTLAKEAQAIVLKETFINALGPVQLAWLDELLPPTLRWVDERKLKLLFTEGVPEIQVKLHECFGLKEHPTLCEGKVAVRIWLTSPDGKRLESTENWPLFRTTRYPKIKPVLQQKFPGNTWL